MQKIIFSALLTASLSLLQAQETVLPAKEQKGSFYLTNATIHIGNGKVIQKVPSKLPMVRSRQ